MSKPLKLQIIEEARALIQDERRWCRGELARNADGLSVDATDPGAVKRCALGALVSAAYQLTHDHWQAYDLASGTGRSPQITIAKPCAICSRLNRSAGNIRMAWMMCHWCRPTAVRLTLGI